MSNHIIKKWTHLAWYCTAVIVTILGTFLACYINQLSGISKKTSNSLTVTASFTTSKILSTWKCQTKSSFTLCTTVICLKINSRILASMFSAYHSHTLCSMAIWVASCFPKVSLKSNKLSIKHAVHMNLLKITQYNNQKLCYHADVPVYVENALISVIFIQLWLH